MNQRLRGSSQILCRGRVESGQKGMATSRSTLSGNRTAARQRAHPCHACTHPQRTRIYPPIVPFFQQHFGSWNAATAPFACHAPKDEVYPLVQVLRDMVALQRLAIYSHELVRGAVGPRRQLHVAQRDLVLGQIDVRRGTINLSNPRPPWGPQLGFRV
jgi:hypothetical protein